MDRLAKALNTTQLLVSGYLHLDLDPDSFQSDFEDVFSDIRNFVTSRSPGPRVPPEVDSELHAICAVLEENLLPELHGWRQAAERNKTPGLGRDEVRDQLLSLRGRLQHLRSLLTPNG